MKKKVKDLLETGDKLHEEVIENRKEMEKLHDEIEELYLEAQKLFQALDEVGNPINDNGDTPK